MCRYQGWIEIYSEHECDTLVEEGIVNDEKQGNIYDGERSDDLKEYDSNDSDNYSIFSVDNVSDEELVEVR